MRTITKEQISAFHAILVKNGLMESKRDIVEQISKGRVASSTELYYDEVQAWIDAMNAAMKSQKKDKADEDPRQKMVNNIIAMAHEMGWIKKKQVVTKCGIALKNNYDDLDAWILKYGYLHIPLRQYTYEQLPKLVTAFKNVYLSYLNGKSKTTH